MSDRVISDSWIREYLRFTENTESPSMFHLWVGLSTIASVLDRDVYADQGFFKVYPNLYIILIAGSQECRKSSAIGYGEKLLRKLPNPPNMVSQKMTPESFIEAIQPDARQNESGVVSMKSTATVLAHELSVFITRDSYKSGLIALLVDLYDCKPDGIPWSYRTKKRGIEEVYNNCINILGGSSPEYLRISLPMDEIGGGFTARTIMVYQQKPEKRVPFPEFTDNHRIMEEKLIKDLHTMSKLKGGMSWTKEAREWYKSWYLERNLDDLPWGLDAYYVKKAEHLISVSTILSVAESSNLVLDIVHLQAALEIMEENERLMPLAFEGLLPSESGQDTQKVIESIISLHQVSGMGAKRSLLLKRLWKYGVDSQYLSQIVDTLEQAGVIKSVSLPGGGIAYVPTKELATQTRGQPSSSKEDSMGNNEEVSKS